MAVLACALLITKDLLSTPPASYINALGDSDTDMCDLHSPRKKGFLIGRVTMHLDFGQDKQRLQSMLKPSGNMCKSIDKTIAAHKSSRQK
jgi:hypothetical protein